MEAERERQRKELAEAAKPRPSTAPAPTEDAQSQALKEAGLSPEEYQELVDLSGQDLLDYLKENGAEILVELFAEDIMECIDDPDIGTCIWAIVQNAGPVKLVKIGSKLPRIGKAIVGIKTFLDKTAAARKKLEKYEEALEKIHQATKCRVSGKPGKGKPGRGKSLQRAATSPSLVSAAASDNRCDEDTGYLYRGIPKGHPKYADALKGRAVPMGGHSDPGRHAGGNTNSEFTSWTHDYKDVALDAADELGPGGIVLRIPHSAIPKDRDFQIHDTDLESYEELEHAIKGTVDGAEISIDRRPWHKP
ncbi:hypothetical protein LUR56_15130 [Streptomyces sp. MT29]|nr:hypothetical protein [Streptomyces sp. MT29]